MKLTLARIAELMTASGEFDRNRVAEGYSIDSRSIGKGELFFAIKGERFDGHDFVEAALHQGAVAAVVSKEMLPRYAVKMQLLAVDDPLKALQTLAAGVRRMWGKTLVGVTGSAGKTTTKEAIAHVVSTGYRVLKSQGNLNNHYGLPLQLLKLENEHEIAVIEMGMSHAGEIRALAKIAKPDVGVVTLVAPVHLEYFDSIAGIARAKFELIESLPPKGVAVLNADDEYVSQFGRGFNGKVITFGVRNVADVRAENIEDRGALGTEFDVVVDGQREHATLPLIGQHNIYNALAGVAVALDGGIPLPAAVGSLRSLKASDKRGEVIEIAGATVINDCYNSNPKALASMVDVLAALPAKRHIVVAGEMLELGPAGEQLHVESGCHMVQRKIDFVVGVRGVAKKIVETASTAGVPAVFFDTPGEAGQWLASEARAGDAVLLKASRGVRLERALEVWKEQLQTQKTLSAAEAPIKEDNL